MYIYVYVYIHIHIHAYIQVHIHTYVSIFTYKYISIYVNTDLYMYISIAQPVRPEPTKEWQDKLRAEGTSACDTAGHPSGSTARRRAS